MSETKVSEYIADFVASLGVTHVFGVTGGGAMHLNDSLGNHPGYEFISTHHEQSAAMAAEGYSRIVNSVGVLQVTSGPGCTNALTGVAGAWIDSIPMLVISGQVTRNTLIADSQVRQLGVQEIDAIALARPITKYSRMVTEASKIRYHLEKAVHLATSGRPGPVWLDIPLDIQSARINPDTLKGYSPDPIRNIDTEGNLEAQVGECLKLLQQAQRPVVISGYGVRLAGATEDFLALTSQIGAPVVSSWNTSDVFAWNDPLYVGRAGLFGDRASNFAVQNADVLLIIGSRMSIPQTGHRVELFAREAKKIVVDIDDKELNKPTLIPDLKIKADAKVFIQMLSEVVSEAGKLPQLSGWVDKCQSWKTQYPVFQEEYRELPSQVNSFHFVDALSESLPSGTIVVTDMGTSFTCTMQTFKTKTDQRLFTSSGLAAMGFGLPGAIGACLASGKKRTICVSGDGGAMFNIQELQTIVQHKLPLTIFILANNGYLTMKHTQQNHFGRYVGSDPSSKVSCPDFTQVANAFGIESMHIRNTAELEQELAGVLNHPGPFLCEIEMPELQLLIPRVQTMKGPNGELLPTPIEDMFPFLERDELHENMIVPCLR
jgi:acetolactate synthase-1/2/3 large subunit